jgi:hypothetical protein
MNRPLLSRALLVLFATLICSTPATGTVRSTGAKIRWVGERPAVARAGQDWTGRFEVVAARPGMLENVRVEGEGWTVQPMAAARAAMSGGQRRGFTFTARPSRDSEPLVVTATFDGREIRKTLRLDEASLARGGSRPVAFVNGPPRIENSRPPQRGAEPLRARTTAFHFTGRFTYMRSGETPVEIGVDNIVVRIWDEDDISDELIWEGSTDVNGYFDVNVNWDDCDFSGCDDPDIYVEFITGSAVVDVQADDVFETTYSWETPVIDDFTGNTIAFGTMMPDDPAHYGACHIYNSVMRAARFVQPHNMTPPLVDCVWPSDEGTAYDRDFEEMYIAGEETWNESAPMHEFGHHLHFIYGNLTVSQYENGYCDTPQPSHCVWCPENDQDAFKEGWANWFASVILRSYQATYGIIPISINDSRVTLEMTDKCQEGAMEHWPGPYTEGYIGAILRDIDDPENDDHDGGAADCHMDALTLGADEIMTVFRDDDPTDIWQFLSAFRTRFPQHDQDLWSTLYNVWQGFTFTLEAPEVTSQSQSCLLVRVGDPVTLSVEGNGSLLKYQWRKDGVPLTEGTLAASGTGTKTLTLALAGLASAGTYDCVVSTCDLTLSTIGEATRITVLPVMSSKHLVSWGENLYYQAGDGTTTWHIPPYVHMGLPNMIQAEGGRSHSIGLDADGQVYTWGLNDFGQLGIGAYFPSSRSAPAPNLMSNAIQIAAGYSFNMALTNTGTLAGWGYNHYGQLGNNTFNWQTSPMSTVDLGGCVIAVTCGEHHTIALRDDGVVLGWGSNIYGALGRGFQDSQRYPSPAPVIGLTDIVAISSTGYTNLALKGDGTVWAWGYNAFGQLGLGHSATAVPTATMINGLPAIRAITAGYSASFAIGEDGSAWSWGADGNGQLGAGTSIGGRNVPGPMALVNPLQIVSGEGGWGAAVMGNRRVRVWGYNAEQINGSSTPLQIYNPMQVPGVVRVGAIGAGYGTVHAMGDLDGVTAVPGEDLPIALALAASPNPSYGRTRLAFDLPRAGHATLAIYDLAGRRVRVLVDDMREPGRYDETWDGRADAGSAHVAGVYFARLEVSGEVRTQRIVRIR